MKHITHQKAYIHTTYQTIYTPHIRQYTRHTTHTKHHTHLTYCIHTTQHKYHTVCTPQPDNVRITHFHDIIYIPENIQHTTPHNIHTTYQIICTPDSLYTRQNLYHITSKPDNVHTDTIQRTKNIHCLCTGVHVKCHSDTHHTTYTPYTPDNTHNTYTCPCTCVPDTSLQHTTQNLPLSVCA